MRLHALQRRNKHTTAGQIVGVILGGDGALDGTAGPECVAHRAPGVLGISSEVGGTILANNETGGLASKLEIDNAVGVDGRLDGIRVTLLIQSDGHVISAEGEHVLIKHEIREGIRVPDMLAIALEVEDLRVEVRSGVNAPVVPHESKSESCSFFLP